MAYVPFVPEGFPMTRLAAAVSAAVLIALAVLVGTPAVADERHRGQPQTWPTQYPIVVPTNTYWPTPIPDQPTPTRADPQLPVTGAAVVPVVAGAVVLVVVGAVLVVAGRRRRRSS